MLSQGKSAIKGEDAAGHPFGGVGEEVDGCIGYFFGFAVAAKWIALDVFLDFFLWNCSGQIGFDHAGLDGIGSYP